MSTETSELAETLSLETLSLDTLSWETPTMAELFYKQGSIGRALCIYRQIIRNAPHDEQAKQRLIELESQCLVPPVDFYKVLRHIAENTPSCNACYIMSMDGVVVESYSPHAPQEEVETVLIEYTSVVRTLQDIRLFDELLVSTFHFVIVIQILTTHYFLATILGRPTLEGKARYLMRLAAPKLKEALQ